MMSEVEGWVSVLDHDSSQRRDLSEEPAEEELFIAVNGLATVIDSDSVVRESIVTRQKRIMSEVPTTLKVGLFQRVWTTCVKLNRRIHSWFDYFQRLYSPPLSPLAHHTTHHVDTLLGVHLATIAIHGSDRGYS